jgi:hypothetical protein
MLEDPGQKNQQGVIVARRKLEMTALDLRDGLDEILVDGDKIGAVFVVHHDIGEADEQPLFLVDRIRDAVSHRRNQKIPDVHAVHRTDANANLLAFWHRSLLPEVV